jgi:hypothetical protein
VKTPEEIAYDLCNRINAPGWGDDVTHAIAQALRDHAKERLAQLVPDLQALINRWWEEEQILCKRYLYTREPDDMASVAGQLLIFRKCLLEVSDLARQTNRKLRKDLTTPATPE